MKRISDAYQFIDRVDSFFFFFLQTWEVFIMRKQIASCRLDFVSRGDKTRPRSWEIFIMRKQIASCRLDFVSRGDKTRPRSWEIFIMRKQIASCRLDFVSRVDKTRPRSSVQYRCPPSGTWPSPLTREGCRS